MNLLEIEAEPFYELPYLNAARRGEVERVALPLRRARVDRLPPGLEAILCAADLQGREEVAGAPGRLLGEALAAELAGLAAAARIPPLERTGVLLAGDLYTVPGCTKRGGSGDVRSVWEAFAERFRWVAGVAGNHDTFGPDDPGGERFRRRGRARLLDGDAASLDGLRVGGVGGVVGAPRRLQRRLLPDFLGAIEDVLLAGVDLLVLHEGPAAGTSAEASAAASSDLRAATPAASPST